MYNSALHLDEQILTALATQRLLGDERKRAEQHLDDCDSCRSAVVMLARLSLIGTEAPVEIGHTPPATDVTIGGKYRVVRLLGVGAMGVVFEAEDLELHRKVAVKLVRERMHGDLRNEARMLAQIAHPNVVAVYEVGSANGQDFVVMELVAGTTLDAWLAVGSRAPRDIARVIADAARGLSTAHAAGILHRDIKPTNLLVGSDGRTRVTDFGLATAATDGSRGELAGTPRYMAPEALRGAASPASDQYSLGVTLRESLSETAPGWLRRIAARATEEDPARRFSDLDAMATALDPERRALRRAWLALGAAGLIGVSAVAVARVTGDADPPPRCAPVLEVPWDAGALRVQFAASARPHAARTVELVLGALARYREAWLVERSAGCTATRIEGVQSEAALDRRTACQDQALDELRARIAVLATATPEVVDRAVPLVESLPRPGDCARDPRSLEPQGRALLTKLATARAREEAGAIEAALTDTRALGVEADQLASPIVSAEHRLLLGELLVAAGGAPSARAAEATLREALMHAGRAGDARLQTRIWIALLVTVGNAQARSETALEWEAFARAAAAGITDDRLLTASLDHAAAIARFPLQRWGEAIQLLEHSLALRRAELGEHAWLVGKTETALCTSLRQAGRSSDALAYCRKGLATLRAALGPAHPEVATAMTALASAVSTSGAYAEARTLNEQALAILERTFGPGHAKVTSVLNNLGAVLERLGDTKGSVELARRVVEIRRQSLGPADPRTAAAETNLAIHLDDLGEKIEARALLEHALATQRRIYGDLHPDVGNTLSVLGTLDLELGRRALARRELEQSIAAYEGSVGKTHHDLVHPLASLAEVLLAERDRVGAIRLLERALALPELEPGQREAVADMLRDARPPKPSSHR